MVQQVPGLVDQREVLGGIRLLRQDLRRVKEAWEWKQLEEGRSRRIRLVGRVVPLPRLPVRGRRTDG